MQEFVPLPHAVLSRLRRFSFFSAAAVNVVTWNGIHRSNATLYVAHAAPNFDEVWCMLKVAV